MASGKAVRTPYKMAEQTPVLPEADVYGEVLAGILDAEHMRRESHIKNKILVVVTKIQQTRICRLFTEKNQDQSHR